ncbi:hypothetical protein KOR42_40090 [Thalassoglobus neptunius]|uniref:Type IV / VI secretion system DotU domain-containing protein n=1 Tax=Thalassoglobus neptunius TaxID=1938619 RepID=A0A5C5WBG1_9PLAN|nr:DotU family type IV/VI secretion system protein [Thalassoglobus neptunius]TWT48218.1 hypothetical protein KOR42_40090 [Thalassoglobus neptunius]
MAETLITLTQPFFLKSLNLISDRSHDSARDLSRLQKELSAELQALEHKVNSGQARVSPEDWQLAKRGLIYWVDEILVQHIDDWEDFVLEHVFYDERNRAWKFYLQGENSLVTGSPDVAELYYLAVVLGFVGDIQGAFQEKNTDMPGHKTDPDEARKFWAQQLQSRLHQHASPELQGSKLEGHIDPLPGTTGLTTASAIFSVMLLCMLVLLSWYLLDQ